MHNKFCYDTHSVYSIIDKYHINKIFSLEIFIKCVETLQ